MMEQNLVKDLESSLQACISTLLSQGRLEDDVPNKTGNYKHTRVVPTLAIFPYKALPLIVITFSIVFKGIDSCIETFLQSARHLEGYFAKYQMYSTVNHPEDAIREDVIKLQEELVRKEALLNSLQDKTIHWNNELDNLINKQNNMFIIDQERRA